MTSQIKAKLLQHFAGKKANGGFTLIELLVVIIIIGILSAIALPSFLNQANKARQSEAKAYVGSMNRGQQAYYMENGKFAFPSDSLTAEKAFARLGLGIAASTDNYAYSIVDLTEGANTVAVANLAAPHVKDDDGAVTEQKSAVKAYQGGVKVGSTTAGGEATTLAILCEALESPVADGADGATSAMTNLAAVEAEVGAPKCGTDGFKTIK